MTSQSKEKYIKYQYMRTFIFSLLLFICFILFAFSKTLFYIILLYHIPSLIFTAIKYFNRKFISLAMYMFNIIGSTPYIFKIIKSGFELDTIASLLNKKICFEIYFISFCGFFGCLLIRKVSGYYYLIRSGSNISRMKKYQAKIKEEWKID